MGECTANVRFRGKADMISKTCNVRAERVRLTATSSFFNLVMRDDC